MTDDLDALVRSTYRGTQEQIRASATQQVIKYLGEPLYAGLAPTLELRPDGDRLIPAFSWTRYGHRWTLYLHDDLIWGLEWTNQETGRSGSQELRVDLVTRTNLLQALGAVDAGEAPYDDPEEEEEPCSNENPN